MTIQKFLFTASSLMFFLFNTCAEASLPSPAFTSAEHIYLGNSVKIHYSANDPGIKGANFHFANGLTLTYGEILAFGDFYEVVGYPISQGATEADKRARFLTAFNSLTLNPAATPEALKILDVLHREQSILEEGMKNGETPENIYQQMGLENDRQINCITGGGCLSSTWFLYPGRSLALSKQDQDHFGDNAWASYEVGHTLALEHARLAHQTKDLTFLEMAYAMDAFANHFLSDRFAAGHIRTPRLGLPEQVQPTVVGLLLVMYMHGEENTHGIHVHNQMGDHWIAYGDKAYFEDKSQQHRTIVENTMQASADEIFATYQTGSLPLKSTVHPFIPEPDEVGNASNRDISPLFYWDNEKQQMMRRADLSNVFDRHWTNNWWGWSTLIALRNERGLSPQAQAQLALAGVKAEASQKGLITDLEVNNYQPNK